MFGIWFSFFILMCISCCLCISQNLFVYNNNNNNNNNNTVIIFIIFYCTKICILCIQAFWYFVGKKDKFRGIFRVNFAVKLADFALILQDFLCRFPEIFRVNFTVKLALSVAASQPLCCSVQSSV